MNLSARPLVSSLLALALLGLGACDHDAASHAADSVGFDFVDVAQAAGIDGVNVSGDPRRWYIPEGNGCGAAWLDYDGDGDLDLFVGNGARFLYHDDGARLEVEPPAASRMYRNDGSLSFTDVSAEVGLDVHAWVNAVTVGDVEGDGDPDLYLACFGADLYFENQGGRFVDAGQEAGLVNLLWAAGAAFGDPDLDGDLDLYVANYCRFNPEAPPAGGARAVHDGVEVGWGPEAENGQGYNLGAPDVFFENTGSGRFVDATERAGLALEKDLCSYAVVFSDVDLDGRPDLLVANDLQPCNLFRNAGFGQAEGRFVEEGQQRGFALDADGRATAAMGLFVEDFDGDGDPDVLKTNFDLEANSLMVNDGRGYFEDRAALHGLAEASFAQLGWGGGFLDADLDGDLDLLVANGHVMPQSEEIGMHPWLQPTQLFEARAHAGHGIHYVDATQRAGSGLAARRSARGVALGDADGDGDLDALIVDLDERPRLLENRTPHRGHWLVVRTIGRESNRDGLGARIVVDCGERRFTREVRRTNGLFSSHPADVHVGLGPVEGIESVEVHWPSGRVQRLEAPPLDQLLVVTEPE